MTWGEKKLLSPNDGYYSYPSDIDAKGDTVCVVTADRKDIPTNINQGYFILSNDSGHTWGEYTRLTYTDQHAGFDNIVIDDNDYIHIVWDDRRNGGLSSDREIYYKRSPGF